MNKDSRFDIDLSFGESVEQELLSSLQGTIEVKADRGLWRKTGNLAIEYKSRGKPSGIAVTEAKHWAYVLMDGTTPFVYLLMETEKLKGICRHYYSKGMKANGGDNGTSEMVLLPIKDLLGDSFERTYQEVR